MKGSINVDFDLVGASTRIAGVRDNIASALNASTFGFPFAGQNLTADDVLWQDGQIVAGAEPVATTVETEPPVEVMSRL